jgi:MYXO-CTERM domain-containing protein
MKMVERFVGRASKVQWTRHAGTALVPLTLLVGIVACTVDHPESDVHARSLPLTVGEAPIGTGAVQRMTYNTGDYMSVAGSGDEHLSVFYDGGRVRGVRFDSEGTVLDLDPWLPLGRNDGQEGSQAYTDVTFGGGVYLVLYSDGQDAADGVYAQVVTPEGTLQNEPQLVHPGSWYGAAVFNGTDFTVAYMGDGLGLTRVALDGTVLEETTTQVSSEPATNRPVLAMGADTGLVVFEQAVGDAERKVYAARFTPEGGVLDPGGVQISSATTGGVDVSVATAGSEFLAVWGGPAGRIYGSLIGADGDVSRQEFPISADGVSVGGCGVSFDGTDYLAVWEDRSEADARIVGARLSLTGDRVDATDVVLAVDTRAGQSWNLDLTWTGSHHALVYSSNNDDGGIQGRLLDNALSPIDSGEFPLTVLPMRQYLGGVGFTGEGYIVSWMLEPDELEDRSAHATRITPSGVIESEELVAEALAGSFIVNTSVATTSATTLFAYSLSGDTAATYIRAQPAGGTLAEPVLLEFLEGATLQVASNGETFLGIYEAGENANGNAIEIWGQRFDASGSPAGESFLIQAMERPRAQLIRSGQGYLLFYAGQEIGGEEIVGSTLELSSEGELVKDHGPVTEDRVYVSAASNGSQTLFVFRGLDAESVVGRLLDHQSGYGEVFQISQEQAIRGEAVGWGGDRFLVAWPEQDAAMWAREVTIDGQISEAEELFPGDVVSPRLTPGPDGQLLLSYLRYIEGLRSVRVTSRLMGVGDTPPVVEPVEPVDGGTGGATNAEASGGSSSGGAIASTGGALSPSDGTGASSTGGTAAPGDPNDPSVATPSPTGARKQGGGCSVSPGDGSQGSLWLLAAGLLIAFQVRRQRRPIRQLVSVSVERI